ncbi:MAG: DJ-1/PfpI family protein [Chthoniobacterales bacterium]
MNRRKFLARSIAFGSAAGLLPIASAVATDNSVKGLVVEKSRLAPPASGSIPVAILISAGLNVIDFSGPWGVFESVQLPDANEPPFHLFTLAETAEIVTSGSGLKLMPHYTFANAPDVKIVVIPAQRGSDAMREWLRKTVGKADVTMSVCTGAFHLARAGLLSGKSATTHHEFLDELERKFPDVHVKRGVRFVESEKISTAGGLTSGTDLALRVVERYFGRGIAQATATYMEYDGKGWVV